MTLDPGRVEPVREAPAPRPASPYARVGASLVLAAAAGWARLALLGATTCAWVAAPHLLALAVAAAVAGLAVGALAWLRWGVRARGPRHARATLGAGLGLAASVAVVLAIAWPPAPPPDDGRLVRARFLRGHSPSGPWLGRVPEVEVVRLGAAAGLLPAERAGGWTARGFDATYANLAAAGDLDPGVSWVVDAWLFDRGHAWVATPPGPGPFPLLVVLHGSGGPFQFLPHALVRAAIAQGFAVVLPSWGLCTPQVGRSWWTESGRRRVLDAIEGLDVPVDPRRVVLVGLSAGGIGAVDVLERHADRFRGGVCISGVPWWEVDAARLRGTPLLVVHGDRDARLPLRLASGLADRVRAAGGAVDLDVVPGDHFILLTQRELVIRRVVEWAARVAAD